MGRNAVAMTDTGSSGKLILPSVVKRTSLNRGLPVKNIKYDGGYKFVNTEWTSDVCKYYTRDGYAVYSDSSLLTTRKQWSNCGSPIVTRGINLSLDRDAESQATFYPNKRWGSWAHSCLPNCVGYAYGRVLEIMQADTAKELFGTQGGLSPTNWYENMQGKGGSKFKGTKNEPTVGSIICDTEWHLCIIEELYYTSSGKWNGYADISWSSYYYENEPIKAGTNANDGTWDNPIRFAKHLKISDNFKHLQGILQHPYIKMDDKLVESKDYSGEYTRAAYISKETSDSIFISKGESEYTGGAVTEDSNELAILSNEIYTVEVAKTKLNSTNLGEAAADVKTTGLLTYPTVIQAPFINVKIGDYTFGTYIKNTKINQGIKEAQVQFPNFVNSLTVIKTANAYNEYTLSLVYQIKEGQDPNFIDKVLSKIGYGNITLTYGDAMAPHFVFQNEEALITGVTSDVDFASSRITYTISAISTSAQGIAAKHDFGEQINKQPSEIIKSLINNDTFRCKTDLFTGFLTMNSAQINQLIPDNDKAVDIPAKDCDILSYINYLVTYMNNKTNGDGVLRNSAYYLSIIDNTDDYGGCYFKITEVQASEDVLNNEGIYEVDVGYPSDTMVKGFKIKNNNSWALFYNYGNTETLDTGDTYSYKIDKDGNPVVNYAPSFVKSTTNNQLNEAQKNWWTKMTRFPVDATLEIKGLLRPILLMTKVRINAFFFGRRHISSGLYVITKQTDTISSGGYFTTLELTRVAGDNDYYTVVKETETRRKVTYQASSSGSNKTWKMSSGNSDTSYANSVLNSNNYDYFEIKAGSSYMIYSEAKEAADLCAAELADTAGTGSGVTPNFYSNVTLYKFENDLTLDVNSTGVTAFTLTGICKGFLTKTEFPVGSFYKFKKPSGENEGEYIIVCKGDLGEGYIKYD